MVRELVCVVAFGVPVPADYIPNIVVCADMPEDLLYWMFHCGVTFPVFFGLDRICLALCRSWASSVVFLTLLTCTTTIGEEGTFCIWCACYTVNQDDVVDVVFVDDK